MLIILNVDTSKLDEISNEVSVTIEHLESNVTNYKHVIVLVKLVNRCSSELGEQEIQNEKHLVNFFNLVVNDTSVKQSDEDLILMAN